MYKKLLFVFPVILLLAAACNSGKPSAEQNQQTTPPPPVQNSEQVVVSNIFESTSQPGQRYGGMVLEKISHPTNNNVGPDEDHVRAEFSGNVTLTGTLSAPTGKPEDAGMGPEYSVSNLASESLKKLPYLRTDTRDVWFGITNPDVVKNAGLKNGDKVELTISKYDYIFAPAGVWNQAEIISIKKASN